MTRYYRQYYIPESFSTNICHYYLNLSLKHCFDFTVYSLLSITISFLISICSGSLTQYLWYIKRNFNLDVNIKPESINSATDIISQTLFL